MAVIETFKDNPVKMLKLDWTTGAATGTESYTTEKWIAGYIDRVVIVPASIATPASGFAVTLTDEDGLDLLKASAASCVNTGPTTITTNWVANSKLDMVVSGAGTSKNGYVKLFWREGIGW